ncbi:uncharacterized protein LOC121739303 isoform X2 [Aricia agestis]|uniref:uncharacterized protein LOC121739303 isoform X2 n=1 Tax=Aricia agestis TaxID=91739 RepID=UPI001C20890C|nr:uncharacterized protein LOC121739303 isoform X2 [Aricia agestis]
MKMGDAVKISKEMWHRSCCSVVDGLSSEWKLDVRASIAKVVEFPVAESASCLQQKTSVLKIWKNKKATLKRRRSQVGTSVVSIPVSANTSKPKRKSTARGGKRSAVKVGGEGTTDRADEKEPVVEARGSELHHALGDEAGKRKMEVVDERSLDAPRAAVADGGKPSQVPGSTQTARHSKVGSDSPRVAPQRQNLPFVCGNTTTSHNIAANVQKMLSSLKNQHVPRGIPPNFANHIGLKKFLDSIFPNPPVPLCFVTESAGAGVAGRSFYRDLSLLCAGDGPLPLQLRSRRTQATLSGKAREGAPFERVNVR